MSLNASLSKFKSELSQTASRNAQYARPSSTAPARTTNPQPTNQKRKHTTAFSSTSHSAQPPLPTTTGHAGSELLSQVWNAVKYLKEKSPHPITLTTLIDYLSLPNDQQKNIPLIKRALHQHERVEYIPKSSDPASRGKESVKYRPLYPVTNADELKQYLARQPTAQGLPVQGLKDGWPDCTPSLDLLEQQGEILLIRHKKDNAARLVYADNPNYHITDAKTSLPQKADADFVEMWAKTKLPASEGEIRTELEKAGLTPTSQVREVKRVVGGGKQKRRVNRKGGKTTNSHMLGILKDYSRR